MQLAAMTTNASYNFETSIGGLKGPSITIQKLSQIEPTTVINWISQIRLLFDTNNNTYEDAKRILKHTIDTELHPLFDTKKQSKQCWTLSTRSIPKKRLLQI
jgi:hypothetical protein